MKFVCFLSVFLSIFTADFLSAKEMKEFFLENAFLYRTLTVEDGILRTSEIRNKRTWKNWKIEKCPEFRLRLSEGTEFSEGDLWLASPDFRCTEQEAYELPNHAGQGFVFTLENSSEKLMVHVRYELRTNEFYMKKGWKSVTARKKRGLSSASKWKPFLHLMRSSRTHAGKLPRRHRRTGSRDSDSRCTHRKRRHSGEWNSP